MTIQELDNYKNPTDLEKEVITIIQEKASDYENLEIYMIDLERAGCVSGMIGALIYYSDTQKFATTHAQEINELLSRTLSSFGLDTPYELFGDRWDKEDNLCLGATNQNLIAWFAFEETARNIACSFNLNLDGE